MRSTHLCTMITILNVLCFTATVKAGEQSGGGGLKKYEYQDGSIGTDSISVVQVSDCEWRMIETSILDGQPRFSKSLGQNVFGLESYQAEDGSWRLDVETETGEIYTLQSR